MFETYDGFTMSVVEMSPAKNMMLADKERQHELEEKIKRQYLNFQLLGVDYIRGEFIEPSIFHDLLTHINYYLTIPHLDTILENDHYSLAFGKAIYRLISIELLTVILPKIANIDPVKVKRSDDLALLESRIIRTKILKYLQIKLDSLQYIKLDDVPPAIKKEVFKYTFYMDLFDNDIELFLTHFIRPIINLYNVEIDAKI